jgi:hypothetical protein
MGIDTGTRWQQTRHRVLPTEHDAFNFFENSVENFFSFHRWGITRIQTAADFCT